MSPIPCEPAAPRRSTFPPGLLAPITLLALWLAALPLVAHPAERFYLVVPLAYAAGTAWLVRAGDRRAALRRGGGVLAGGLALAAVHFYDRSRPSSMLADGERTVLVYGLMAFVLVAAWMYAGVHGAVRRVLRVTPGAAGRRAFLARCVSLMLFSIVLAGYAMAEMQIHFPKRRGIATPRMLHRSFENVRFASRDGVELAGWFVPAKDARRTALVCHGVGADKSDMLDFIEALAGGGFNVLAFDFRGHGESGGRTVSYGARERLDIQAAVDWLEAEHPDEAQHVVGVGWSMGAASLILAAAEDERIEALHVDAPYARTRDIARIIAHGFPPVYRQAGYYLGLALASLEARTNLFTLAPVDSVARIAPRPILIVHGERDKLIPIAQGRALYAAAGEPKSFVAIPGAGHCGTLRVDSPRYERRMLSFLNEALTEKR